MKQNLEILAQIVVPEKFVILEREEYENLKEFESVGRWWTLEDVLKHISMSRKWLADNILNNPKFKTELDVNSGGFVKYPIAQGGKYLFLRSRTMQWLEENFSEIMKEIA
ncbi:DUF771 domain-containing protein [Enterococcus sp. BWR-S5]|uniref:DUF771 domain-containing protein n=1 Tax=Enterococcus sp. BWR-S5 TaxID=2787714 RepID=UPI001921740C|nr:DUF771 domain-containing protein [Enterococcus sp. BWR-S5]MBL1223906.1 DUF771 domain-containing protein [Enterococcus sp. BWR-S5]